VSIEVTLPMGDLINPGQNRLASVQVVNWGTFDGAHTIHVDRAGTLLTGESGVGKSTIFDGILQILEARPRMNEAAQTGSGTTSEERRTTFSYMRGRLGSQPMTAPGRAQGTAGPAATSYQRDGATWSAVSLTFDNALGQVTSLSVLLDLPANGTENSIGRFYLLHNRPLDIAVIETRTRGRFTKGGLEAMLPGSQAFDSHKQFAERFRQVLGVENEKAFGLLRMLQAGKGLGGTVNDFFRHHVLDEPKTLLAAEEAVEDFSHLSSIRRQLERARQQRDHLAEVPARHRLHQESAAALEANRALAEDALPLYRQQLERTLHEREHDRLAAQTAAKETELAAAESQRDALKQKAADLAERYRAQGGGAIATLERELAAAVVQLQSRETTEAAARAELAAAGIEADWSPAGLATARSRAAELSRTLARDADAAKERSNDAQGQAWTLKGRIRELEQEIESFRRRTSNIRQDSLDRRALISAGTGIPEEQMPFAAELIDVAPEHAQWRPAAERALRPLATSLLVPGEHMRTVTAFISANDMRGFIRCLDVGQEPGGEEHDGGRTAGADGTAADALVGKLVTKDTPMGRWVRERIAARYDYVCVEDPDGLAAVRRGVSLGGAVKRNAGTTEKDDRHTKPSDFLLGFDNKDKIAALAADLLALRDTFAAADSLSQERAGEQQELTARLAAVRRIAADTRSWEELSAEAERTAVATATQRLEDARDGNADLEQLRFELDTAELDLTAAVENLGVLKGDLARLQAELAAASGRLDRLRSGEPGDAPASVPDAVRQDLDAYFAPHGEVTGAGQLNDVVGRVERQLLTERAQLEKTLLETGNQLVRTFETFAEKWGSDYGTGIDSAPAYEERYANIVSEGLPQREAEFQEYFNNRTYERFSDLLQLLDEERRVIAQRLLPLNQILGRVEYHADSHLEIEIQAAVPDAAHAFRTALKNALPIMGRRQTEAEMDAQYLALERIVDRLKDHDERRWRAEVLDVRGHVSITCTNRLGNGHAFTNLQAGLMSGGEGQRFTAFIMAAALAYQLGIVTQGFSTYGTVMMDEAFVKSSLSFAEASINALHEFGFQLLLAAPEDKVDLSRFLGSVTEILRDDSANRSGFVERGRSLAHPVDIILREAVPGS
jgi:uncharacterized protein YPO0396